MVHRGHLISLTDLIGKINIMTKKNIDDFLEKSRGWKNCESYTS